jgi:2-polyprenyl-6-methoxyphenol hydroxylase-like FAD-dependent oxidoreductase
MKIKILGAGPAGLHFAALMKRRDPTHDITVFERGPRDATWGFGVVFSDRALEFLRADDEELYHIVTPHMETWNDIAIVHNDTRIPIAGNGFSSIGRLKLLTLLYAHAETLGIRIEFGTEITSMAQLGEADLIVGSNGAFSWVRAKNEDKFGTTTDWRPNRFIWYGTSKPFDCLTLTFRETTMGVFCAHHYRYAPDMSTFLVEVEDATWRRVGFESMSPEETVRACELAFAKDLDGHPILSNGSYWRQFPAIWNRNWSFDNVVLIGDALRTAHFSIGSGTRPAMEDAIALNRAFAEKGNDTGAALARFQEIRLPPMKTIWDAANVSLQWYEHMDEHMKLAPIDFAYSYITRTGRMTFADIKRKAPDLAAAYAQRHPEVLTRNP